MKKIGYIIIAVVVVLVLYGWSTYNKLVRLNESAITQFAQTQRSADFSRSLKITQH